MSETDQQRQRYNHLLERLGSALLSLKDATEKLKDAQQKAHSDLLAMGNAHLTQMVLLRNEIAEARKDVERAESAIDDMRRDLTPVHGTPLPAHAGGAHDDSIEISTKGAKLPIGAVVAVGRGLPWLALGVIIAALALLIALWASGERIQVIQRPAVPALHAPELTPPKMP